MEIIIQIYRFAIKRKKFWLIPLFIVSLLFGLVIVMAQGSPVSPFFYALF
jgi:hypothetical protein